MSKTMLLARIAVAAPDSASGRFMYVPGGRHKAVFTSVGSAKGIEASTLVKSLDHAPPPIGVQIM